MSNTSLLGSYGDNSGTGLMFRNRILNGAMVIDQRNAGAVINPAVDGSFAVDRWKYQQSVTGKFSAQQNAGSVTPPAGFTNYLGFTSLSAYSVGAGDYFLCSQVIEGFNVADFNWGTANAQSITVSFWVRSSLTGSFGGAIENSASNRTYPFGYTISAANTWEQKTVIIPGDTSGTWLTNNGAGLILRFNLGSGSTYSGPAGAWSSTRYFAPTGATSVVGTNGATFYLTGVQLEAGPTATPFERRPYSVELGMAQRYYYRLYSSTVYGPLCIGHCTSTNAANLLVNFPVTMRVPPVTIDNSAVSTLQLSDGNTAITCTAISGSGSQITTNTSYLGATVAAGLTIYRPIRLEGANNANAFIGFSAEL